MSDSLYLWCLVTFMISSYPYAVCLPVWYLPACMYVYVSTQLYDACFLQYVWLPEPRFAIMLLVQYNVLCLFNACIPIWFLPLCIMSVYCTNVAWLRLMSGYLYDVSLPVVHMSAQQYDVCLRVWCLPVVWCLSTLFLYYICSTVWLPTNTMSAFLYYIFLSVWFCSTVCLLTCKIYVKRCNVCPCIMSVQLYDVCIPMMFA